MFSDRIRVSFTDIPQTSDGAKRSIRVPTSRGGGGGGGGGRGEAWWSVRSERREEARTQEERRSLFALTESFFLAGVAREHDFPSLAKDLRLLNRVAEQHHFALHLRHREHRDGVCFCARW